MNLLKKISYARKVLPGGTWRALSAPVRQPVHLIMAVADHFEPAIDPSDGQKRVARSEQERRLEWWSREYPKAAERWRDHDGRPFVHTYFYPAEQYDEGLVEILAEHCHSGWGETEIHLHHGIPQADTAENTRRVLTEFRDRLAFRHRCLSFEEGSEQPRYCFVHGNFALANSAGGRFCGVDSEMQLLAETGCYADFTLPTGVFHPAQTAKINSMYECGGALDQAAPHQTGIDLAAGRTPRVFPLIVQGPLLMDLARSRRTFRPMFETGAITAPNPMTLERLALWKQAGIHVGGRPDWLFIKLHCHSMDPTQKDAVIGGEFQKFLGELVSEAGDRKETLHFVSAREMANIILAACDGKDGDPGEYRDYRFRRLRDLPGVSEKSDSLPVSVKG
ncbi:MAG TPA: hypothetical protein VK828_06805 [Terriglobales bacterium]|jgi:hypothetical protein|nr:hypothetical protein [Terriglobales bacterium]